MKNAPTDLAVFGSFKKTSGGTEKHIGISNVNAVQFFVCLVEKGKL